MRPLRSLLIASVGAAGVLGVSACGATGASHVSTQAPLAAPAPARCAATQVAMTRQLGALAMGNVYEFFTFTNDGATSCTLGGLPALAFTTASGQPIVRMEPRAAGPVSAALTTVNPGAAASFWVDLPSCGSLSGQYGQPGSVRPALMTVSVPGMTGTKSVPYPGGSTCGVQPDVISTIGAGATPHIPGFVSS